MTLTLLFSNHIFSQRKKRKKNKTSVSQSTFKAEKFNALKWRNIGPFRGGRTNAVTGVQGDPLTYFFGGVGGGIWKTEDAGGNWKNISDGQLKTGSVGAIEVAPSDKNVIYVGMGEHAVRGVMTSHGDGMYKSTDGGMTWKHIGLSKSMHIAEIQIHPQNPEMVWVAVQGAAWAKTKDRGVYKTADGGRTWKQVLFVNSNTACADLSLDKNNPRILYAGMWDNQRTPWGVRSGGAGSGIWKSVDGGETWKRLEKGLPKVMGKIAVDVSSANPQRVFANIEAEGEKGGVYRSDDGGKTWKQTFKGRISVARAWYYIEIFADPVDANKVYVLNAPMLRSIDGGNTFERIANPHTDQHDLWINKDNPSNMILGNDGGACISFNSGKTWSTQNNQPTAQFYRVITDNRFPYFVYGGQQDNSTVAISSQTQGGGIGIRDWYPVAGGESAFIAFDPDNPKKVYGTSIQGFMDVWDAETNTIKDIQAYPQTNLGTNAEDMKYRFNWNGPLAFSPQDPNVLYCGGNILLQSKDEGLTWKEISKDLTRNDKTKHGAAGFPFTNEAAGGEVYNTISYIATSPHQAGDIWVGSDDGLVHRTTDDGKTWMNITPSGLPESLINAIEISPSDANRAYLAVTRYKYNDQTPMIYMTNDGGKTWQNKSNGIPKDVFVRVVREDKVVKELLYAGTERGLYVSFNSGNKWEAFQSNLPICPVTDLIIQDNDLVAATSGRAFWILDDLSALQQSMGKPSSTLKLFEPTETVKFSLYAGDEAPNGQGQNPKNGVTFDYYLPEYWQDTFELTLYIEDASGKTVRTISNKKPEKMKRWEGGPPPPQVLPNKPGLNRFHWDLRKDQLPAIENVFVMGDYRGHFVAPGEYKMTLTSVAGKQAEASEVKVKILADKRLEATPQDHLAQQKLLNQIEGAVLDIHQSVNRLRSVKSQLDGKLDLLEKMKDVDDLLKKGEEAKQAIKNWEETLIQPKQKTFQDVINFKNQLNAELLNLRSGIDGHDPRPTAGQKERLQELMQQWNLMRNDMERVIRDEVGGFNKLYESKNLPALILPEVPNRS